MEVGSSNLKLRLGMVEIEELKPHEEIIESLVAKLTQEITEAAVIRDPLIVDQRDMIILDGMHRFNSLKRLKCRFAPCCLLDYTSPQIMVGSWFRGFEGEEAESVAQQTLTNMKLDYSINRVDSGGLTAEPGTIIITKDAKAYSLPPSTTPIEHCQMATSIESRMVTKGHKVTYLSESTAMHWLKSKPAAVVIVLPVLTKDMIRRFGAEGLLFPHKVTRHVIPSRPMEINVPLTLLTDPKISRKEADEKLSEILEQRRIERKPPGTVIDGRRYDEELIVFSA